MRAETDPLLNHCRGLLTVLGGLRAAGGPPPEETARPLVEAVWPAGQERRDALAALASPFLALTMLERTLVRGFRGNPGHLRPTDDDGPRLAADLLSILRLHLRMNAALPALVPWPRQGVPAGELTGDGGWCDLCGMCCCHCGTVPTPPAGAKYPPWFHHAIAGESLWPQPFCPFLFQAIGQPLFFCGLHPIKPLSCSRFDQKDCQRGLPGRGFLRPPA